MLMMSDVSGPNAVICDDGYLTGYPLAESGVYALARTWAATEMTRPGCVWTHTLLIDFADLATLPTMRFLLSAFRRPNGHSQIADFETRLDIQGGAGDLGEKAPSDALARVIFALYGHPRERIIASSDEISVELVFSLWAQQWPRLRRAFRFCTLTFGDRSSDGSLFDLQLIPNKERSVRTRFSGSIDADRLKPTEDEWLEAALSDLLGGPGGSLRAFLRDVGGDLVGGREAFMPLCRLHRLVAHFADHGTAITEAVQLLTDSFDSGSGTSLRSVMVESLAKNSANLGPVAVSFLLEHLDLLNQPSLQESVGDVARAIWHNSPEKFVALLSGPPMHSMIAETGLDTLSAHDIIQGLRGIPESAPIILAKKPRLVEETELWKLNGPWTDNALIIASQESSRMRKALAALLNANRSDAVPSVVRLFGVPTVLRIVSEWPSTALLAHMDMVLALIMAAVNDSGSLALALSERAVNNRMVLTLIARSTSPDYVPNAFGEDPWWTNIQVSGGDLDDSSRQYLAAYLLARALGDSSRNQAELVQFSFDQVYLPAARSSLSAESALVLESRLPRPWWFDWDWDYCQRIREAVVAAFVDRDLKASTFALLSNDDEVFRQLAKLAARTGRGRRYLKGVLRSLAEDQGVRSKIIRDLTN
jgi:hypothetical protein